MKRNHFLAIFIAILVIAVALTFLLRPSQKEERPANGSIVPASLVNSLKHQPSRQTVERRLGRPIKVSGDCIYYRGPADHRTKQGPARARGSEKWINYRWQLCFGGSKVSSRLIDRQLYAANF